MKVFNLFGHTIIIKKTKKVDNDAYFSEYQKTGRTTRIIDEAINELFSKGETALCDHTLKSVDNEIVLDIMLKRLLSEHRIASDGVIINRHSSLNYIKVYLK